ncbi:MAG: cyclohexanecarboxylate-CoA ligase [Alphaproteobacteria bacterium]|nr:cyclohexanecarboxylate-CoA ligase [Alphaproteobacteria bacterium]
MPVDLKMILPESRIAAMRQSGQWPDMLLTDALDKAVAEQPDSIAFTGFNSMRRRRETVSFRQLDQLSKRIALGLVHYGIGKGDMVSFQLPNWWEFVALHLACVRIGAISNPVMPIFRERELSFMLDFAETKAIFVPCEFRGFDHPAMISGLRKNLPALQHMFVLGGEGAQSFEENFLLRRHEDEVDGPAIFAARRMSPNDVNEMLYTSGTTGQPKGVMHTANTQFANLKALAPNIGLSRNDTLLMSSPLAHQTGFLYGIMMPLYLGIKTVYQDVWDARIAAQMIQDEKVTYTMASTPFLADLTDNPDVRNYDTGSLRIFMCGGAPIPRVLTERATRELDIKVLSLWGMSENGAVTITRPDDPMEKVFNTDGKAISGTEVRIVDENGQPLPPDTEGLLQSRGCSQFVGYMKKPEMHGTDKDGWFDTGDYARMDADGYIRITGRAKDILIRGGENIPVVEVEEILYRHPAIADAAIVGMPDPRLGERGCAFVTLQPGASFGFAEMTSWLNDAKLARNYMPERLEVITEMPRTASGKIQKFKLREAAKEFSV